MTGAEFSFPWEISLMEWLQTHLGDGVISVISFFSVFGETLVQVLLCGFLYWSLNKEIGARVGRCVLTGMVWNPMVKNVFVRRRPYFDHPNIRILRVVEPKADIYDAAAQGWSFPSGHSTSTVTSFGSVAAYGKKKWLLIPAVLLPLLVGFSRVTVGAHYPTDVLAGWLVGLLAILFVRFLEKTVRREWVMDLILLGIGAPGLIFCRSADYYAGFGLFIGFAAMRPFEKKYVRFENAKKPLFAVLRVAGGGALFLVLEFLLKLPFSAEFLGSASILSLLIRCARYAVIAFVEFGVYPMVFKYVEREKKSGTEAETE